MAGEAGREPFVPDKFLLERTDYGEAELAVVAFELPSDGDRIDVAVEPFSALDPSDRACLLVSCPKVGGGYLLPTTSEEFDAIRRQEIAA